MALQDSPSKVPAIAGLHENLFKDHHLFWFCGVFSSGTTIRELGQSELPQQEWHRPVNCLSFCKFCLSCERFALLQTLLKEADTCCVAISCCWHSPDYWLACRGQRRGSQKSPRAASEGSGGRQLLPVTPGQQYVYVVLTAGWKPCIMLCL